ncbi:MAG: methyltransferase family protein [Blastocatellia bacterium]
MTETQPGSTQHIFRKRLQRLRVPLGFITAVLFVAGSRPTWRSLMIGLPIALGGVLIRAWASGHLRKNAELAVSGPYAHTRNPLYFGSFVMAIGCAAAGGHPLLGLMLIGFFLLVYMPVMQAEVSHMESLFAESYARWAAHVPLFLPRLTPHASGTPRGFDPRQYLRHREYRALAGLTIVMAFLIIKAAKIL